MAERKFISEFGLNMLVGWKFLLQQDHLHIVSETDVDPHIYFICRMPRITLDPESISITRERLSGVFRKQIKDKHIDIPFDTENVNGYTDVKFESVYPYTDFKIVDTKNGRIYLEGKSVLLLSILGDEYREHLNLEVLYIGQSYGKDGSRNAGERLQKHETLQEIYSEAMTKNPDQDIWLLLCTFQPLIVASFDGRKQNYQTTEEEDTAHISNVLDAEISEQQKINFTEAALIRYFQPEYNKTFKDTFPNPAHLTYRECYDIELNMVCVELQTDNVGVDLWSSAANPSWIHMCKFPLHSKEDRKYMLDLAL